VFFFVGKKNNNIYEIRFYFSWTI